MLGLLRGMLAALLTALAAAGCVTVHGPTSFTLSRDDIERAIEADLGDLMEVFRGVDSRRPEVAFMPVAGRLELAWYVSVPSQSDIHTLFGRNVGVAVVLSGKPTLNAAGSGINLTDVRVDDVRVLGLPRLLGFQLDPLLARKDLQLPNLPLFSFSPAQLRRADVAYGATAVEVTYRGLRVDIAPR
jgi:hypothetical protein